MEHREGARGEFPLVCGVHEVSVGVLLGREGNLALRLDVEGKSVAGLQGEFAQAFAAAGALGLHVRFGELRHGRRIAAQERAVLAVDGVFPRSAGEIVHLRERTVEVADETRAAEVVGVGREARFHVDDALRVERVVDFGGAERAGAARLDNGEAVFLHHLDFTLRFEARVRVAEAVVLDPAVVVVAEALAVGQHLAAVEGEARELCRFVVEGQLHAAVADFRFVESSRLHHFGCLRVGLQRTERCAAGEFVLAVSHGVAGLGEALVGGMGHHEVEQHFLPGGLGLGEFHLRELQREREAVARCHAGQADGLCPRPVAVEERLVAEREFVEGVEGVGVFQLYADRVGTRVGFEQAELDVLVGRLHLSQLRALLAGGGQDAVGAEVALVRAGEVVARVEAEDALLDFLRFVDGLVHPVPDAAADGRIAVLNDVPVFREVADGVAHGVGILAEEHRLVHVRRVAVHPSHARVHLRVEVGETSAAEAAVGAGALVVDGAAVEAFGRVVAGAEVLAVACLVAEAPHYYRGMVAVAQDHAVDTVHEGRHPRLAVGDALVRVVLEVSFVAGVEAVVVVHGIHAGVVGVVRGADGVDVVLLHEEHVA